MLEKNNQHAEQQYNLLRDIFITLRFLAMGSDKIHSFPFEDRVVQFFLPWAIQDPVQRSLLVYNTFYEIKMLKEIRSLVPRGCTVLDVGANIGNHAVFFSLFTEASFIYAFEGLKSNFDILARNIELNQCKNTIAHCSCIGQAGESVSISRFLSHNLGATSFSVTSAGGIPTMAIDDLRVENVGFIKIDVEGMQKEVIAGSAKTIARDKPYIWMEVNKGEEESIDALKDFGYETYRQLSEFNFLFRFPR